MATTRISRSIATGLVIASTVAFLPAVASAAVTSGKQVVPAAATLDGKLVARRGADDPTGDTRNGKGTDDGASHT